MDTMYDRLGKLLSETLEAGAVKFVKIEREPVQAEPKEKPQEETPPESEKKSTEEEKAFTGTAYGRKEPEYRKPLQGGTVYHVGSDGGVGEKTYTPKPFIYKKVTPEIERAYRLLGIETSATPDDVKKAYKEKIKYYHPDKYNDNAVLQKVATDKTRQVVEAYKLISDFLEV